MQRPKWLSGWGNGKNLFEGSLIIDIPEIKVVEASFDKKLLLFALGTMPKRDAVVSGERNDEYKGDLEWKIFYDTTALPNFMPADKAKEFMAGAVAMSSGNATVYNTSTIYIASGNRPSKGNAPLLLDYDIAKKIEGTKKKK
jgi:hypothetical protein